MTLEAFAGGNGGQTTVEYALLIGVITLPLIFVLSEFGLTRFRMFEAVVRALMP
jgi:Flp pilus assembly pilin Flp